MNDLRTAALPRLIVGLLLVAVISCLVQRPAPVLAGPGERGLPSLAPQFPAPLLARDSRQRPRVWFVGTWETRNVEFGRDVTIVFVMRDDASIAYDFIVDGEASRGSTGTWRIEDHTLHESWLRPDGSTGVGRGEVEVLDENTFRLTIIDNGYDAYRGLVRTYRRRPGPQLSQAAAPAPPM